MPNGVTRRPRAPPFPRRRFGFKLVRYRRVQWQPECHRSLGVPRRHGSRTISSTTSSKVIRRPVLLVIGSVNSSPPNSCCPAPEAGNLCRTAEAIARRPGGCRRDGPCPAHRGDGTRRVDVTLRARDGGGPERCSARTRRWRAGRRPGSMNHETLRRARARTI